MLKTLMYILTALCCCGITYYQVFTSVLDEYIPAHPKIDNATYGNVDEIATYNFFMNVTVDFDQSSIFGSNTLDMQAVALTDKVVLDIWDMDIYSVELVAAQSGVAAANEANPVPVVAIQSLEWKVVTLNEVIGQTLAIQLPNLVTPGELVSIRVHYSTQKTSMALSWMTPAQTAGKKLPYLFSQCESINCRSVAPLQDTPSTKVTYGARIVA